MAIIPQPGFNAHGPITPDEAKHVLSTGLWENDPALKLVIQDAIRAENFEASKMWVDQTLPTINFF
jgi:hypothetical protein